MVILKSPEEIKYIRKSCKLAASALKKILEKELSLLTTMIDNKEAPFQHEIVNKYYDEYLEELKK